MKDAMIAKVDGGAQKFPEHTLASIEESVTYWAGRSAQRFGYNINEVVCTAISLITEEPNPGVVAGKITTRLRIYGPGGEMLDEHKLVTLFVPDSMKGSDICCYCGADNGPNGEYRNGFDCYYCGSN